ALTLILFAFHAMNLFAQNITVSGRVTDGQNPIASVSVNVDGGSAGVSTEADGTYRIQVPGTGSWIFSSVGYATQTIKVNDRTSINVTLMPQDSDLEQVVVVGYGTQKKATLTGSVVEVKGEEIIKAPVMNVSNSLSGRLPGLTAVQRS